MKRFLGILATVIFSISLCLFVGGCSFIRDTGSITDLPDSNLVSQNVTIGYNSQEGNNRQELSMVDAVAMVERSAVAVATGTGSAGSGVLIEVAEDGTSTPAKTHVYMITNHHVISAKGVINVTIPDKDFSYSNEDYIFAGLIGESTLTPYYVYDTNRIMDCAITLVGSDMESDIAVLKIDLSKRALSGKRLSYEDLVTAKIPPASYSARRGETVFAIGNPTGSLPGTVSSGIISYLEREVSVENVGKMKLMQIDVPTNPGSSGGGLYNLYGELIGITNSGLESKHGLNNAIPISVMGSDGIDNGFVNVARSLIATSTWDGSDGNFGYITGRKEKLGFTVTKKEQGSIEYVSVIDITKGSVADSSGLVVNDIITKLKINNTEYTITSYDQFVSLMAGIKIGDVIVLTVPRGTLINQQSIKIAFNVRQYIFCDTGIYNANN